MRCSKGGLQVDAHVLMTYSLHRVEALSWLKALTHFLAFQVYEVLVPTDDDKFVRQALHIFAQFATEIRCSPDDLAKERGAVLEVSHTPLVHSASRRLLRLPAPSSMLQDATQC